MSGDVTSKDTACAYNPQCLPPATSPSVRHRSCFYTNPITPTAYPQSLQMYAGPAAFPPPPPNRLCVSTASERVARRGAGPCGW